MNLIGKIFVLVIVLMSLLFMTLAMAVYSTHKNWRDAYVKLDASYKTLDANAKKANSAAQLKESELQGKLDAALTDVANLQSEREALVQLNDDIQSQINQLNQERRDATAAVKSATDNAAQLSKENGILRRDVIAANEAADESFKKTQIATGELHDRTVKLAAAELEIDALVEEVAIKTEVMRNEGLDPDMRVGDTKPTVGGFVSSIRRRGGDETIEISIGSDDGIKRDHTVEIFRMTSNPNQTKWLGRAVVLSTDGDRAYARVIPKLKEGRIQEGDRVATRLN